MDIALRIKILRKSLKLTQKEFAEAIGFSQSHLCAIENNSKSPSTDLLFKISKLFGVKILWLSNGIGEIFANNSNLNFKELIREPGTYCELPEKMTSILSKLENGELFSFEVESDNMEPIVKKGDEVLIDKTDLNPDNDSIFLFDIDSKKILKHCFKLDLDTIKLTNDKSTVKNNDMILDNSMKCLGRLVWVIRKIV